MTPLPSGEFSIGSVDALDAFLTENPLPDIMVEGQWPVYLGHCRKMVDAVAKSWPRGDPDYQPIGSGFLELADDANATIRGILDLYEKLLVKEPCQFSTLIDRTCFISALRACSKPSL